MMAHMGGGGISAAKLLPRRTNFVADLVSWGLLQGAFSVTHTAGTTCPMGKYAPVDGSISHALATN